MLDLSIDAPLKIDIGAGKKTHPGWTTVGLESHHQIQTDIRKLPLPDACVDEAQAIHVLEHLNRWDAPAALADWCRVLKSGAMIGIELPELLRCCRAILKGAAPQEGIQGLFGEWQLRDEMMMHRHGWTEAELSDELYKAGFVRVRFVRPRFHGHRDLRDMRAEAFKP
jgi:predicted SAM-dependent methyltransferase